MEENGLEKNTKGSKTPEQFAKFAKSVDKFVFLSVAL